MQEYLNGLDEWHDEMKISALFATFKARETNPESFDYRMNWWKAHIIESLQRGFLNQSSICLISLRILTEKFERNGVSPLCFETVLKEMIKNRAIIPIDQMQQQLPDQPSKSLMSSLYNFVAYTFSWKKGFNRSFDSLSAKSSSSTLSHLISEDIPLDQLFIYVDGVKELADKITTCIESQITSLADRILTMQMLEELIKKSISVTSSQDLSAFIKFMCWKGTIRAYNLNPLTISNGDEVKKVYYFIGNNPLQNPSDTSNISSSQNNNNINAFEKASPSYLGENDIEQMVQSVGILKVTIDKFANQLCKTKVSMNKCRQKMKEYLAEKNASAKRAALFELKRLKGLEKIEERCFLSISTMEDMLLKIDGAHANIGLYHMMNMSCSTIRSIMSSSGITIEAVDKLSNELLETNEKQQDISEALLNSASTTTYAAFGDANGGIISNSELEAELELMMAASPSTVPLADDEIHIIPAIIDDGVNGERKVQELNKEEEQLLSKLAAMTVQHEIQQTPTAKQSNKFRDKNQNTDVLLTF